MRKRLGYILLALFISLVNINVVGAVGANIDDGHQITESDYGAGYSTQKQWVGDDKNAELYCLDKGRGRAEDLSKCTITNISNSGIGSISGTHDQKEAMYRLAFDQAGLARPKSKYDYNSMYSGALSKNKNTLNGVASNLGGSFTSSTTSGELSYNKTQTGEDTYTITASVYATDVTSIVKTSGSGSLSYNCSGNKCDITITGVTVVKCKGTDIKIKVNGNTGGTEDISDPGAQIPGSHYFVQCPDGAQNYVMDLSYYVNTPGRDIPPEIITLINSTPSKNEYTIKVTGDCNCKGASTLCQNCNEKGESHDNEEYARDCAESGAFEQYCGVSLKKEDNNDTNTTVVATYSTIPKVTPSNQLASNDYCRVYCLEHIEYKMPGVIHTKDGRYFKLKYHWDIDNEAASGPNVSIKGTRTCITSNIQISTYITDIKARQDAVQEAYNNYQKDKKFNEALEAAENQTKEDSTGECLAKDSLGNCTNTCSYTIHYATDDQRKYISRLADYDGVSSVTNVNDKEELTYDPSWVSSSNCPGKKTSTKPKAKVLTDGKIKGALDEMYKTINMYKSCFEWTNTYCFDPQAYFQYEEVYNDSIIGEGKLPINSTQNGKEVANYYTTVTEDYKGQDGGYTTRTMNYLYATTEKMVNENVSLVDVQDHYVKKVVTSERTFGDSPVNIYSYHPYGTVSTTNCGNDKCTYLGNVIPVALQHKEGTAFEYNIKFKNVGVDGNDQGSCASHQKDRINGDNNCSLTAQEGGCTTDGTCYYTTVPCPDCIPECKCPDGSQDCFEEGSGKDKICYYKKIDCPECTVECVGCIWNNGDTAIAYKPISLDNVYEKDEEIGSNWTTEEIKNIEDKGQEIYGEKPIYSFTLSPQTMHSIREYNRKSIEGGHPGIPKGGYSNDTLTCTVEGTTVKECKSSFIREYLKDKNAINGKLPWE